MHRSSRSGAGELPSRLGRVGSRLRLAASTVSMSPRNGTVPDINVYDAAAWSAPAPLSEQSVAGGSMPVEFPDFTRGRWKTEKPW